MEFNAFSEGVRPGGITTTHEIIILICYMVEEAKEPVSLEQIQSALMKEELVNYFEFASATEYMIKSGHLLTLYGKKYTLSTLGSQTASTFADGLPQAVKDRAVDALTEIVKRNHREEQNRVEITKKSDGYEISMTICDIGTDLLTIKMFMPNREQCEAVRRRFLNDPLLTYKGVFALLTGDLDTVGELIPNGENLFEG